MTSCLVQTAGLDWLTSQMQIESVVSLTKRELQDVTSAWGQL